MKSVLCRLLPFFERVLVCIVVATGFVAVPEAASAQSNDGSYADVTVQSMVKFPGDDVDLSVLDGNIFVNSAKMLLDVRRKNGQVLAVEGDTVFRSLDEEMSYVVRHPSTGNLYFTEQGFRNRSYLYVQIPKENNKYKIEKVKLGDVKYGINHPVFSNDGTLMVFSSDAEGGFGGFDLWYSVYNGTVWSQPINLGQQVNTPGDEVSPFVVDNYLFFSSNGRVAGDSVQSIYVTQLIAKDYNGDTSAMLFVGFARPQRMPYPVNSGLGDVDFVYDKANATAYWVSYRQKDPVLCSFNGTLEGVDMGGMVADSNGRPLAGVNISAFCDGRHVGGTQTAADGSYELFLQSGRVYDISFSKDRYFSENLRYVAGHSSNDLFQKVRQDACLTALMVGKAFRYSDIYGDNADFGMTADGGRKIDAILRFLQDNPQLSVSMTLRCAPTSDESYNQWLTDHRIAELKKYVAVHQPNAKVTIENGNGQASGIVDGTSVLTVKIF